MKRPYFIALLVVFSGDALLSALPSAELHSFNAFAKKPGSGCSGSSCSALPPTSQGCSVHGNGQNVLHNPHCLGTSTSTTETPGGTPSTTATTKETTVTDNHQETTNPGTGGNSQTIVGTSGGSFTGGSNNNGGGTKGKDPGGQKQKTITGTGTYGETTTGYAPVPQLPKQEIPTPIEQKVPPLPDQKTPPLPLHPTVTLKPTYNTIEGFAPVTPAQPSSGGSTGAGTLPITVTGTYQTFTAYGPVTSQAPSQPPATPTRSPNHGQVKILTYQTQAQGADHRKFDLFSARPGPSMTPGHRSQFIEPSGKTWTCALSGMGRRKIVNQHGLEEIVGNAETLHFQQTTTAHLPSNHRSEARCLVLINKQATSLEEIKKDLAASQ